MILTKIALALSLASENVKYAEQDAPPLVALYTLLVLTTTFNKSPYYPKYSVLFNISSLAISGAIPITQTNVFCMTLRFYSFLSFSFDKLVICILLLPFCGGKPKLFKVLTHLQEYNITLIILTYLLTYALTNNIHTISSSLKIQLPLRHQTNCSQLHFSH